jgi:hypothetical protein
VEKITGQELRVQPIVLLNLRLLQSLNQSAHQTRLLVIQQTYQLGLLQLPLLLFCKAAANSGSASAAFWTFSSEESNIRPCSTDVVGGEGENHKDGVMGSCLIASDAESLVEGFTGVMGDCAGEEEVEDIGVGIPVPFAVTTSAALRTFVAFICCIFASFSTL